jgi:hypothetical protein
MKLKRTLLALALLPLYVFAQAPDSAKTVNLNLEVSLASRNIWRGLDYGSSPSIQGTFSLMHENFEIGTYGTTTLNGSKQGFGTWVELFATYKYRQLSLTIDDYFFFNAADSMNNYLEWDRTNTQHFIESRLKFDSDKFDFMAGYAFYKNKADHTTGIYMEAEYSPFKNLSFIAGGVTGANWLSFYDAGGVTTLGVAGKKPIQLSEKFSMLLKTSLIFNPSYDKSVNAPGVGTNPVYVVIMLTI